MPTDKQSQIQSVVEGLTSVNANAQNSQPANPNNGNPNTVANQPNPNVNLIPAQADANGNWWTPPVTSGINLQGLIGQLPRTNNSNIDNIIGNLTRPPAGPGTGPGGPGTTPPPGPGPGTPGYTPPPGAGLPGRPVGPISGPIDDWLRSGRPGPPPDATNPTNLFDNQQGREWAMDWLRGYQGDFDTNTGALRGDSQLANQLGQLAERATGEVKGWFSNLLNRIKQPGGWRLALSMGSRILGAATGNPLLAILGRALAPRDGQGDGESVDFQLDDATIARMGQITDAQVAEAEAAIQEAIDSYQVTGRQTTDWEALYNSRPQYTEAEWRNVLETIAWNNLWYGNDQVGAHNSNGARQPTVGLPALDNIDVMINNMNRRAVAQSEWFRNLARNRER